MSFQIGDNKMEPKVLIAPQRHRLDYYSLWEKHIFLPSVNAWFGNQVKKNTVSEIQTFFSKFYFVNSFNLKFKVWFHNCYNDNNNFLCFLCMISARWTSSCFWSSNFTNDCNITIYNDTKRHKITQQNFWSQKPSWLAVCKTPHTILKHALVLVWYTLY